MTTNNWKLNELDGTWTIVSENAEEFVLKMLDYVKLPKKYNPHMSRSESFIDWEQVSEHSDIFFDYEGNEDFSARLQKSSLGAWSGVIVVYLQENLVINLKTEVFIDEWEDIAASTLYNSLIFSPGYDWIMEITRDYFIHSNFFIE